MIYKMNFFSIKMSNLEIIKLVKFKFFVLAMLLFSVVTKMSAQDKLNSLTGNWVFMYESSIENMDSQDRSYYDRMTIEKIEKVRGNYEGRVMEFYPDGKFLQKLSDGREFSADWKLKKNSKEIIVTDSNGVERYYKIISISASQLILRPKVKGNVKPLISSWYFKKMN